MSRRLIQPGLLAAGMVDRNSPWWLTGGTLPMRFPCFAASDDDDDSGDSDDPDDDKFKDDDDKEHEEDDEEEDDKPKGKKKKTKKDDDEDDDDEEDDNPRLARAARQAAKYRTKLREAEAREAKLEERLRAIEDKDKPKDEVATRELTEAKAKADRLAADKRDLLLRVAFLSANVVDWVDPEDALRLIDLSELDVADDGTVDKRELRAALRDLARRKPHLVKKAASKKASGADADDEEDDADQGSRRSAATMNGKRKGTKSSANKESLMKDFPALRRQ